MQSRDLIPLFKGELTLLDADAQTTIATWACMTTMTAEHLPRKPDAIVASQAERKWLMKKRMPPQNWRIWIGKFKRQAWRGHWVRVTLPVRDGDLAAAVAHYGRIPNIQATTFMVGELYVHALSGAYREIIQLWDWRTDRRAINGLNQIWPVVNAPVWGLVNISDQEAESFATAFKRYSDDLARREGFF